MENLQFQLAVKIAHLMQREGWLRIWIRKLQFLLWRKGVRVSTRQIEAAMGYYAPNISLSVLKGPLFSYVIKRVIS